MKSVEHQIYNCIRDIAKSKGVNWNEYYGNVWENTYSKSVQTHSVLLSVWRIFVK